MNYYFLVGYLPEIQPDDGKIKVSLDDILSDESMIHAEDRGEIETILLGQDILILENILSGRSGKIPYSVYDEEFWREQIANPQAGPDFIQEYLSSLNPDAFSPSDLDRLYVSYYQWAISSAGSDFLKSYFQFEMNLRNILAAWRASKLGRVPADFVMGDNEVTDALIRSNAEDFGLGSEYPWIERIIGAEDPKALQTVVEVILWEYLETAAEAEFSFSFGAVLSYLLRLKILEKRLGLDRATGMEAVRRLEDL